MWQLLSIFLDVVLPVLILVIIGYLAGPRLELQARTLSRLALYILTPALIFDLISAADIRGDLAVRMIVYIVVVEIGCTLVSFLVAWLQKRSARVIAAYVLVGVFANTGNFGLPIIQFRFGREALSLATVYFLAMLVIAFSISMAAANWHRGGKWTALLAVLKTPPLLAVIPALLVNWLSITPPLFFSRSAELLGWAAVPVMLVTLGIQLADMGIPRLTKDVYFASAIRLLAGPILAFSLAIPFALTGMERGAGVLQASMPTAVFASIIALETDLVPDFVTTTVLFTTLASLITLTVILSLV
jgi:predicted permease